MSIEKDGLMLDEAIAAYRAWPRLPDRDKAFAHNLVATVLRRRGQLDVALNPFMKRDPHDYVRQVLRLGAAQILFLRTPVHAAVSEMVGLVKNHQRYKSYTGLVNAVLRKVATSGETLIASRPPETNLPVWLAKSWEAAWGKPVMRALARQALDVPPTDISVKSDPELWAEKLEGTVLPTGSVRLPHKISVPDLEGFTEGAWWVQDLAASLPVKALLKAYGGDLSGKRVLDVCAAPGGKTLQLAAAGAEVTALDVSKHRLKRLEDNLRRTGLKADIICSDALIWDADRPFDIVLLDAPCSATGTFRRHPDVLWSKSPEQVESLVVLQEKLLRRATSWVKPGGDVIYCVCSLLPEEGEHQIAAFLSNNETSETVPQSSAAWPDLAEIVTDDGNLRVFSHVLREVGGVDGFFVSHIKT